MLVHEITIRYRVPLNRDDAHVHGLGVGEQLISQLCREFPPDGDSLNIPYVRCDGASIVSNA